MPLSAATLSLLLLPFFLTSNPTNVYAKSQDLLVAIEEMQRSTYFTYVVLINMAPDDLNIQGNITFLMPNDRVLANSTLLNNDVSGFLLSHAIPTSLFFEDMLHFPTGTIIPTLKSDFRLHVLNSGRRHFFLDNIQIVTPNICTGSSIKCHGIDGVIRQDDQEDMNNSSSSCSNSSTTIISPTAPDAPPPQDANQPLGAPSPTQINITPSSYSPSYLPAAGLFHLLIVLLPGLLSI